MSFYLICENCLKELVVEVKYFSDVALKAKENSWLYYQNNLILCPTCREVKKL